MVHGYGEAPIPFVERLLQWLAFVVRCLCDSAGNEGRPDRGWERFPYDTPWTDHEPGLAGGFPGRRLVAVPVRARPHQPDSAGDRSR